MTITIPPAALDGMCNIVLPGGFRLTSADARAAALALLENWPGMSVKQAADRVMLLNSTPAIILPLTETDNG